MWLKVAGFKELVRSWWEGYSVQGSFSTILAAKLKALKLDLKVWSKEVFGNVSTKKPTALIQLGYWDSQKREKALTEEEREVKGGGGRSEKVGSNEGNLLETKIKRTMANRGG
ncbi:hypothetical protein CK203_042566 [Vitis vinifera]|uniref:Uncharacterized protein n=1 Tax=Vitis vinifera TaxID=29760 RepID=A0A438I835_VITVI|nr:hypothetical protein CK203_042566 [Vitis vinifera]